MAAEGRHGSCPQCVFLLAACVQAQQSLMHQPWPEGLFNAATEALTIDGRLANSGENAVLHALCVGAVVAWCTGGKGCQLCM